MNPTDQERENMEMQPGEFVARFTAELVSLVGPTYFEEGDPEPRPTADYAAMVAPTYYDDADQRVDGPEECARSDHSYWGE
jgi:hypothetical protein